MYHLSRSTTLLSTNTRISSSNEYTSRIVDFEVWNADIYLPNPSDYLVYVSVPFSGLYVMVPYN